MRSAEACQPVRSKRPRICKQKMYVLGFAYTLRLFVLQPWHWWMHQEEQAKLRIKYSNLKLVLRCVAISFFKENTKAWKVLLLFAILSRINWSHRRIKKNEENSITLAFLTHRRWYFGWLKNCEIVSRY